MGCLFEFIVWCIFCMSLSCYMWHCTIIDHVTMLLFRMCWHDSAYYCHVASTQSVRYDLCGGLKKYCIIVDMIVITMISIFCVTLCWTKNCTCLIILPYENISQCWCLFIMCCRSKSKSVQHAFRFWHISCINSLPCDDHFAYTFELVSQQCKALNMIQMLKNAS